MNKEKRWKDGKMVRWLDNKVGKMVRWLGVIFLSTFLPFYFSTCLYSADMEIKLNSSDGSTALQIKDSGDVVVSSITSDGVASFSTTTLTGNLTIKGNLYPGNQSTHIISYDSENSRLNISTAVVKGNLQTENDIFPGKNGVSQDLRSIYDNSTNFRTTFSSNVYVTGSLKFGQYIPGVIMASSAPYSTSWIDVANNSAYTDVPTLEATFNITYQPALVFFYTSVTKGLEGADVASNIKVTVGGNDVCVSEANDKDATAADAVLSCAGFYRITTTGNVTVKVQYKHGNATFDQWIGPRSLLTYWMVEP